MLEPPTDFAYMLEPEQPPPPTPDAVIGKAKISVLTSYRGSATKRFTPTKMVGYSIGKYFHLEQKSANNIDDLARILTGLQSESRSFIVRGTPAGPARDHIMRRSLGEDATFRDDPCHWVCIDLDSIGTVKGPPAAELRQIVESAPQLQGVTCVCQVSSRWGIEPGVRAHLWFWLEEPRTSQQVSEWAAGLPFKVDHGLFTAVQPHYTADPIFEGVKDPLAGASRVFVLRGRERGDLYIPAGTAHAELDHWVAAIQGMDEDSPRHPLVNRAAYFLGQWVGAGVLDAGEVEETLFNACLESGVFDGARLEGAKDEILRAMRDGMLRPRQCEDWKTGMIRNKDGGIKPLPDNFLRLFKTHPGMAGVLGYDVRTDQTVLLKAPPWAPGAGRYPRQLVDADDVEATAWVNRIGIHVAAISPISNALSAAAVHNPFDKVVDWLEDLPQWDRTPRLFHWLSKVTGCEDSRYTRAVGGRFIISLVARALRPGCKVDDMLVLVGAQGALKSTLLRTIVSGPGDWAFSDCLGDIRRPQDYMPTLMGPWLVEVAELSQFTRKEVEAVKKFLSTQSDRFRLAYGRRAIDIARRGCIAGTSNTDDFLSDVSGNRRFWPVDVSTLNLKAFEDNREQIFAEALYEFRQGTPWYLVDEEVNDAMDVQADHTVIDSWEDRIRVYLDEPPTFGSVEEGSPPAMLDQVTTLDVLRDCLQIPASQANVFHSRRVAGILKRMGWRRERPRIDGQRVYVYVRPNRFGEE